jgi:hypothetical protein
LWVKLLKFMPDGSPEIDARLVVDRRRSYDHTSNMPRGSCAVLMLGD